VSDSWGDLRLIEVRIMKPHLRRLYDRETLKRDAIALLAPIAATFAMILLWFFG